MPKDMQVIEETGGHHVGGKRKHSRAPAGPHEARPPIFSRPATFPGPWVDRPDPCPLEPSPDVHLKCSGSRNTAALFLIKPRCFFDKICNLRFLHIAAVRAWRSIRRYWLLLPISASQHWVEIR